MNRTSATDARTERLRRRLAAPAKPAPRGRNQIGGGLTTESAAFLLEASRVLADSLDIETTLASVARLSLPHLGSWCIVDLCEGDHMRRLAIIHPVPARQGLANELLSGWPPLRGDPLGVPSAVRNRRSEVVYPITDEMLMEAARSPENLALLRELQIGSFMTVPLIARRAVLGAITYVAPNHGDSFSERELALAEDLAARCAIAIDNARHFQHAREAQAQAEVANLAKLRFLSSMSHELRTPLNAISGYLELLESGIRGALTPAQLSDLRRIRVNQRHLMGLVEAVLSFARIDAGKIEYAFADVLLSSVLADTEMLITPLTMRKRLTVGGCWHPGRASNLTVYADQEKLRQILVNLLTNAIKFSPEGGRIEIVCEQVGERVEIRVSDHGVGIAPEHLDRIFEPFVQVGEGRKEVYGGIGLGLAISRELALGMGGDLFVESEPERGSTFTLVLLAGRD